MQIKLDFQFAASFKVGNLLRAGRGGLLPSFLLFKKKKTNLEEKLNCKFLLTIYYSFPSNFYFLHLKLSYPESLDLKFWPSLSKITFLENVSILHLKILQGLQLKVKSGIVANKCLL